MTEEDTKSKIKAFGVVTKHGKLVRNDILEQYAVKAGEASKQLPLDGFMDSYSGLGLVQPLYNPEALANIMEINTYHYRCCKTKARDAAGLGWNIKPLNDKVSTENATFKEIERFFANQTETVSNILDKMMVDYESVGYAALELVREGYKPEGKPVLLGHIPAHTIRVHKDGHKFCQRRGGKSRWFKMAGEERELNSETGEWQEGTPDNLQASEIIWFTNYTPRSDYYGLPDIIPALGAVWGDIARRNYNIAFFDNYGVPAYAVFVSGNFDPGDVDENGHSELENVIEQHFADLSNNPHSTLILTIPTKGRDEEVKVEFQQLSVETKEASFRLYRTDNRDEVLSAHGVPPYRVGVNETGSLGGSTAVESTEIYKSSVLEPRQEMIEATFNRIIIWNGFDTEDFEFKLAEIDTTDQERDVKIIGELFMQGAVTPNQIIRLFRDQFGLEESDHPAMDAHYINGQPIDYEKPYEAPEMGFMSPEERVILSLNERLLEVATKHADDYRISPRD